jgi:hypothetical protein
MRRPGGIFICSSPDGMTETDTFTCGHCNSIVAVQPKQRPEDIGGLCKQCMKLICACCVTRGNCDPLEEKLKRAEAREHALRSYGM